MSSRSSEAFKPIKNSLPQPGFRLQSARVPSLTIEPHRFFEDTELKSPESVFRPVTAHDPLRGFSFQNFTRSPAYLSGKQIQETKKVSAPKEPVSAEKGKPFLSTWHFNNVIHLAKVRDSPRLYVGSGEKKAKGSLSSRSPREEYIHHGLGDEAGTIDSVHLAQELKLVQAVNKDFLSKQKKTVSEITKKAVNMNGERNVDTQDNGTKVTGSYFSKKSLYDNRKKSVSLASPRGQMFNLEVLQANTVKEGMNSKIGTVENNKVQAAEKEKNLAKIKPQSKSQAVFRMKQFKKVKDIISKKKQAGFNIAIESALRCYTHRKISSVRSSAENSFVKENAKEKNKGSNEIKDESVKTPEKELTEGNQIPTERSDKKPFKPFSLQNYEVIYPVSTRNEYQKSSEKTHPSDEDIEKAKVIRVRRNSAIVPAKIDMRKFLKSINAEGVENIHKRGHIQEEIGNMKQEKAPPNNDKQNSAKESRKRSEPKVQSGASENQDNFSHKIKKLFKNPASTYKETSEPPVEKQEEKPKKFIEKKSIKIDSMTPRRRKNTNALLGDLEELSKISIKQFEISESWECDNLELMKSGFKELIF